MPVRWFANLRYLSETGVLISVVIFSFSSSVFFGMLSSVIFASLVSILSGMLIPAVSSGVKRSLD